MNTQLIPGCFRSSPGRQNDPRRINSLAPVLKHIRVHTLSVLALLTAPCISARAGQPAAPQKAPVETLCEIPGLYREYPQGDLSLIITCHLVSTRACLYLPGPCNGEGQGTTQGHYGNTVPAPQALQLEQGQKFFARYNEQGEFVVKLVESYELKESRNADGTISLTFTYK